MCDPGFTGDGVNCTDLDECEYGHNCSPVANCNNMFSSYICKCLSGFSGKTTIFVC